MRKAGFFKGGRFMAKGLIHGESGDQLQTEAVFLIKLLSRFPRSGLFRSAPREGAPCPQPSSPAAALAVQLPAAQDVVPAVLSRLRTQRSRVAQPLPLCAVGNVRLRASLPRKVQLVSRRHKRHRRRCRRRSRSAGR